MQGQAVRLKEEGRDQEKCMKGHVTMLGLLTGTHGHRVGTGPLDPLAGSESTLPQHTLAHLCCSREKKGHSYGPTPFCFLLLIGPGSLQKDLEPL